MRWIEPTASPSMMAPSARTSALARRVARRLEGGERSFRQRLDRGDARLRGLGVAGIALDAEEGPAQTLRRRPGGAGAAERVEHQIVRPRGRQDHAGEQRLGFLGRVQLLLVLALEALLTGAQRQRPVRAHLDILVAGLEGLVIEGVAARRGVAARPDQGLVSGGGAGAAGKRQRG